MHRLDFLRATLPAPLVAMIPKGERDPAGDDKPRERERRRAFKNDQVYSNGEWNDEIIQEHINNGRRIDLNGCDRLPKNTPLALLEVHTVSWSQMHNHWRRVFHKRVIDELGEHNIGDYPFAARWIPIGRGRRICSARRGKISALAYEGTPAWRFS